MKKWYIPVVLALTTFVHYLDRNTLALALPQIAHEQNWTNAELGLYGEYLLGSFYVSFGLFQIFLSKYAERWSIKSSLLLSIIFFSLTTFLFYPYGYSLAALVGLRFLLGAGESLHMPMNSAIIAHTFPPHARGRANSIYVAGILLALMLSPVLLIPLIEKIGWRLTFAVLGAGGLFLCMPLVIRYIPSIPSPKKRGPSTLSPLREGRLRWYLLAGSANAFCIFGMLNWLPSYLHRSRGIPFDELSLPLLCIFGAGIVGLMLWAWIGDRRKNRLALARGGLLLSGVCVLLTEMPVSDILIMGLLTAGVFFQSTYNAQEFATLQSFYPSSQVGAVTGLYNGLTVLVGGVGGSFIPGAFVAATGSFQAGLMSIAFGAFLVALALHVLLRRLSREPKEQFSRKAPLQG
ncbi:MAG: MFS transporter [Bacteroidia bacterium]|nr:MFS transporter [Bacteroidia bacterium]